MGRVTDGRRGATSWGRGVPSPGEGDCPQGSNSSDKVTDGTAGGGGAPPVGGGHLHQPRFWIHFGIR